MQPHPSPGLPSGGVGVGIIMLLFILLPLSNRMSKREPVKEPATSRARLWSLSRWAEQDPQHWWISICWLAWLSLEQTHSISTHLSLLLTFIWYCSSLSWHFHGYYNVYDHCFYISFKNIFCAENWEPGTEDCIIITNFVRNITNMEAHCYRLPSK